MIDGATPTVAVVADAAPATSIGDNNLCPVNAHMIYDKSPSPPLVNDPLTVGVSVAPPSAILYHHFVAKLVEATDDADAIVPVVVHPVPLADNVGTPAASPLLETAKTSKSPTVLPDGATVTAVDVPVVTSGVLEALAALTVIGMLNPVYLYAQIRACDSRSNLLNRYG